MSHDLTTKANGEIAMIYTGETPWHGLGKAVPNHMSMDEACDFVEFPHMLERAAQYTLDGQTMDIPDRKVIIRGDNLSYVATVGKGYQLVQYKEAFREMGKELIGNGAHIETAGLFANGASGWVMARMQGDLAVDGTKGKDTIARYLLIHTSHDGSANLSVITSPVRTVCRNTVRAAFAAQDEGKVSLRHSKNIKTAMSKAQVMLADSNEHYARFAADINLMASKGTTEQTVKDFLTALIPVKATAKHATRSENIRAEILNLALNGRGQDMDGVKGTVWALYNGVTEYVDHFRGTRGDSDTNRAENRLESVWFGSGADLKDEAYKLAVAMAK